MDQKAKRLPHEMENKRPALCEWFPLVKAFYIVTGRYNRLLSVYDKQRLYHNCIKTVVPQDATLPASEPVGWDSLAEGGHVSVDESGVRIRCRQGMSADLVVIQWYKETQRPLIEVSITPNNSNLNDNIGYIQDPG